MAASPVNTTVPGPARPSTLESLARTGEDRARLARGEITMAETVQHLMAVLEREGIVMSTLHEPWHLLFYKAKKNPDATESLKKTRWDWDGPVPKCVALDDYIFVLGWTGSTFHPSVSAQTIRLNPEIAELWLRNFGATPENYRRLVESLAKEAKELFPKYYARE
jgi:hypothetical protein